MQKEEQLNSFSRKHVQDLRCGWCLEEIRLFKLLDDLIPTEHGGWRHVEGLQRNVVLLEQTELLGHQL